MSQLVQTDIFNISIQLKYSHSLMVLSRRYYRLSQRTLLVQWRGEMLPVIFFAVLFGIGLSSLPATTKDPLLNVFHAVSETMFRVTHIIMKYAPVGVFGLIAVTVATSVLLRLFHCKLVVLVYGAILFFALVVLGITAKNVQHQYLYFV